MKTCKLIFDSQYGFRKNHSTEPVALELVDRICNRMDCGNTPISVFLDLSKTFDTLDHQILLRKLKYYGITNIALNWFDSYVSNRSQYVDIEGVRSGRLSIKTVVP